MHAYFLHRDLQLSIPPDVAWAFFSNPANWPQLAPPAFRLIDVSPEAAKTLQAGLIRLYKLHPPGWATVRWALEVTHLVPGVGYTQEQKLGPFAWWRYELRLEPLPAGVRVSEQVYYALPLGAVGAWLHGLWLRPKLEAVWDYRLAMLREFFGDL